VELPGDEPWSHHVDGTPVLSIAEILRVRAARDPDLVAIQQPGLLTTFADLDRRSNQVARGLQAAGVAPGDRVALVAANGPTFLEVLYGAAKAGAIATPVNNRLAAAELRAIIADAEPRVVVTDAAADSLVGDLGPGVLRLVIGGGFEAWREAQPDTDPGGVVGPHDTALILYTSGTTGRPKGIELTGANFGCALRELQVGCELEESSVCAAPIPFFHVAGLGLVLAANLTGSRLLLEDAADTLAVMNQLIERRVTHACVVPTVLQRLLALPEAKGADWSHLRYVIYGASPIPLPVVREATAVLGCKFLQSYGLTESTGGFTLLGPADHLPDEEHAYRLRSAGRLMDGAQVRIVDPVTLVEVAPGERGEVQVRGSRLMKGYWRQPELTAQTLTPDGWLRTGDGGSFDADGFLYLHDRLKDMIVSGGENVYPAEVESVMTGHPGVAEVAVVGIPSERWGESPFAVVVPVPGAEQDEAELLSWTRERLAHFKCPVGVAYVDALPRTASGKLQKAVVRDQIRERVAGQVPEQVPGTVH
jgi:long-chain acyl-CoA synthetase